MNAAQMLHDRYKKGLQQMLEAPKRRTRKERAALEAKLAEAIAFERENGWIIA